MSKDKTSILDLIFMGLVSLSCGGFAFAALNARELAGGIVLTLLTLACIGIFVSDLRHGVRAPTRWEWFKVWMNLRPVLVVGVGVGAILLLMKVFPDSLPITTTENRNAMGALCVGIMLLWAGLVFYFIWRAPHRHEADAAYKRRIGYRGEE